MNINELRFSVAVAQERNFRKAAEKCFVSQPALSTAIQKLEEELGVKLFERSKSQVTLTAIGITIIAQAVTILEEIDKLKLLSKQSQDPLVGQVKLGVIYTIGPYLIPDLISPLHQLAPLMPISVEENTTDKMADWLKQGSIDVAIVALPFDMPGIDTIPLYQETFDVIVPKNHPWAQRTHIDPVELAQEKVLLLSSIHCFSAKILKLCPDLTGHGAHIQQGNSLETIRNMVASGLGISVLPSSANRELYQTDLIRIVQFNAPVPNREVGLAFRKGYPRGAVLEVIKQAVKQLTLPGISFTS
ncbi:LysR family transcriptional regulator [Ferrovum sp. PN-J185]|uniref:LysR substrate-binding domain-containing protein n=1 Tax=Ferrovum sp. PN-J185 TaxID=1356306 RepID=UPI001E353D64|nr:LysR substrate-binding domain-containing protein [Ferrovum sp. PN-J185]MCC6067731.1 LysR family transcriptional regulator [Ferrovum sp. PN-J185]MDE1891343.1 LysR family transcriptional regulator [Betaproteobacteria bacterium]MDE2056131.1 LysR family transcriptional regulator [Betaproteobacteria bacterium]